MEWHVSPNNINSKRAYKYKHIKYNDFNYIKYNKVKHSYFYKDKCVSLLSLEMLISRQFGNSQNSTRLCNRPQYETPSIIPSISKVVLRSKYTSEIYKANLRQIPNIFPGSAIKPSLRWRMSPKSFAGRSVNDEFPRSNPRASFSIYRYPGLL